MAGTGAEYKRPTTMFGTTAPTGSTYESRTGKVPSPICP